MSVPYADGFFPRFDSIDSAIKDISEGKFVIVLDDENRENEGDLICSADKITTEQMAWFIRHTSGFICISLHPKLIEQINLPMMVPVNTEKNKTAYTITLDYRYGTTTGISAHDRALTSRKLAQTWQDFCRPGHLCPLRYTEGGVRRRRGHTEASVDLCVAADLPPAALLCELVDPNDEQGGIASRDACFAFAKQHSLKIITIEALERWREEKEGPLPASIESASTKLDQERGVRLEEQEVVGPAHANGL
ncbi:putative RIB3-3,4-dihydroxy-2-butanone 4-phosphate synthase [Meira miltonrushii]|uniref:3,4-dihydroxy-2-butanone 4-phosphate synthase n=1 Tax=Meira miltonrushii TaxID=1280837 RepID=A0A316VJ89_9BASI|nr:putative RIB3-3,4-dihydroxy-2-butanone 4-phosphate synthase [Meira miltonrushii]PWN37682.1 putative RIB3-3,4-dihydroxy-2-butanone 4-phosphate synthase [Meira miltonrushii]